MNLDFLSSIANVERPRVNYLSNARPFNIWSLKTTIPTTVTTVTTTTEATTESEDILDDDSDNEEHERPVKHTNSPVSWLGKFFFNGLPTTLMEFKSPFSPLYWYDSLKDINYPSTQILNNLF